MIKKVDENTLVSTIIHYPLFENYGKLIIPTGYRFPEPKMTLSQVAQLLPYHDYIDNKTSIEVVNEMLTQVNDGQKIFFDIYSKEEKNQDPTKEETGLFFFKGHKNAPFALISAGGGFLYVASIHESFPHALFLSKQGYNAFALQYRTGGADVACEDLAAAIAFIFEHAKDLEIDVQCYSLWGGSAGARMAAYLGTYQTNAFGQKNYPQPGTIIMQYTGHRHYSQFDPPIYVCVGKDDYIASWQTMKKRIDSLDKCGIDTEFHLYENLGHGFGLGIGTAAQGWIEDATYFWQKQIDKKKGK